MDMKRLTAIVKRVFSLLLIVLISGIAPASCKLFAPLDNPADPEWPNYQGYTEVVSVDAVVPMEVEEALAFPPTLKSALLVGGTSHRIQICADQYFAIPEYDKEQTTNIFVLSDWIPS